MKQNVKKSHLDGIPAWAFSLMIFFSTIGLFELLEHIPLLDSLDCFDFDSELIMVAFIYAVFLTTACFFICRKHPKSVWYTPLICSALIIFVVIVDEGMWTVLSEWISMVSIIVLSVTGAIVGSIIGRRSVSQVK